MFDYGRRGWNFTTENTEHTEISNFLRLCGLVRSVMISTHLELTRGS